MPEIDLLAFLRNPESLNGVSLNESVDKVLARIGPPKQKIGDKRVGFLHYDDGLRYGYFDDEIDELAIYFLGGKNISYHTKNDFGESFTISENTLIHEFIYILNTNGIKWKGNDEKNISVFSIKINSAYALFDLMDGRITKIAVPR